MFSMHPIKAELIHFSIGFACGFAPVAWLFWLCVALLTLKELSIDPLVDQDCLFLWQVPAHRMYRWGPGDRAMSYVNKGKLDLFIYYAGLAAGLAVAQSLFQ